jgi:hypothetical protein
LAENQVFCIFRWQKMLYGVDFRWQKLAVDGFFVGKRCGGWGGVCVVIFFIFFLRLAIPLMYTYK